MTKNASSRAWGWYVNVLGASPLLRGSDRRRLLRSAGLDVQTDRVGPACYFHTSDIRIGPGTLLNHGVHVENVAPVEIGADCALSMYVRLITSTHEMGPHGGRAGAWRPAPVRIGDGCWLGAGVIVLPGVTIGAGCMVAAGAVVTKGCADDGLYAGVPARRVRHLPAGPA
jgi:maltose O-acetyltransferase